MSEEKVTLGTDIEAFIIDKKTGVEVTPLVIFPQDSPQKLILDGVGIIERDGYAIEFQPNASVEVKEVKENLRKLIHFFYKEFSQYTLSTKHIVHVDLKALQDMEDWPSLVFGCKPDYNARSKKLNDPNKKVSALVETARTAGCHIHIGIPGWNPKGEDRGEYVFYSPENKEWAEKAVNLLKWIDLFVGLKSVVYDIPSDRRNVYGKSGDFRFTAHGIEYRTLSNFPLLHPAIFENLFLIAENIGNKMLNVKYSDFVSNNHIKPMIDIINECKSEAKDYLDYYINGLDGKSFFNFTPLLRKELPKVSEIADDVIEFWS